MARIYEDQEKLKKAMEYYDKVIEGASKDERVYNISKRRHKILKAKVKFQN
jgi:hypothetical protein